MRDSLEDASSLRTRQALTAWTWRLSKLCMTCWTWWSSVQAPSKAEEASKTLQKNFSPPLVNYGLNQSSYRPRTRVVEVRAWRQQLRERIWQEKKPIRWVGLWDKESSLRQLCRCVCVCVFARHSLFFLHDNVFCITQVCIHDNASQIQHIAIVCVTKGACA